MNCKWFEVFLFFLFLASKNMYAPKMLGKTKGKIIFVEKWGRRWNGCVIMLPFEVLHFTSSEPSAGILLNEDQHLISERNPNVVTVGFGTRARDVYPRLGAV